MLSRNSRKKSEEGSSGVGSSSSLSILSNVTRPQHHEYDNYRQNGGGNAILRQSPPSAAQPRMSHAVPPRPPPSLQAPLVLDPEQRRNLIGNNHHHQSPSSNMVQSLQTKVMAAARGLRETPPQPPRSGGSNHNNHKTPDSPDASTAAQFARNAPHAGFLQKLGVHVTEWKRRFFVLKPATHLYYFVSPHDSEPRGCIDLQGSAIEPLEYLADGRVRFGITWTSARIILEARNEQVGKEWMKQLETQRIDHVRHELQCLESKYQVAQIRISELERQVQELKLVERDRDGALEDAARWKHEFETLDEGLRLLALKLQNPQAVDEEKKDDDECKTTNDTATMTPNGNGANPNQVALEKNPTIHASSDNNQNTPETPPAPNPQHRQMSLLDDADDTPLSLDEISIPGLYFSSLSNACLQIQQQVQLASLEAATAVQDAQVAQRAAAKLEKRMAKAEKHLCKMWEENCTLRRSLKQKKREKRVLVREVKSLLAMVKESKTQQQQQQDESKKNNDSKPLDDTIGSDEERLINELEEHVISSIRLHEQLLAGGDGVVVAGDNSSRGSSSIGCNSGMGSRPRGSIGRRLSGTETASRSSTSSSHINSRFGAVVRLEPIKNPEATQQSRKPLFDDRSEDDDETEEPVSAVSSVCAELGGDDDTIDGKISSCNHTTASSSRDSTPRRPNPVLMLDQDEDDEDNGHARVLANNGGSLAAVTSSNTRITDNGKATSKLACPLADVVVIDNEPPTPVKRDLQVYHLTFYTRKIGILFQKVPAPTRPSGLLTEAMRADLTGEPHGGEKTAAELRRIATISTWAKSDEANEKDDNSRQEFCKVASPVDSVLVCGFNGFDDSSNHNIRPKLGARLVAFDGISVEVGRWTFESIGKAIKARGRPLTLSFRNDFLTREQRAILTRAVNEVDAAAPPPPKPMIQYRTDDTRSVNSAFSHETDHFVNEGESRASERSQQPQDDDDFSVSVATSEGGRRMPPPATATSKRHYGSASFRSFSEAGSSSVLSAAFAPLMANLMTGLSETSSTTGNPRYTPEYLQRRLQRRTLQNTPQHQDFQSNLL